MKKKTNKKKNKKQSPRLVGGYMYMYTCTHQRSFFVSFSFKGERWVVMHRLIRFMECCKLDILYKVNRVNKQAFEKGFI